MVFRDRQGLSPKPSGDPLPPSNNRDRYLDNCFLLCINRNDDVELPEIHRLENDLMRELCNKNPWNQTKSQQQSKMYSEDQRDEQNYELDDEDFRSSRPPRDRDYLYRRKQERDSPTVTNRSRYYRDGTVDSHQYSRPARYHQRDDYNIMQHSDDELSVYEVYVPTNTLNRLSDKRIDNNMVLIDYEDVSMMRDTSSPYGPASRNNPSQYNNYRPLSPYIDPGIQYQYDPSSAFARDRDEQLPVFPNIPSQQMHGYYGNERDRPTYSPQSGPFPSSNVPMNHSNAINVRRHIYSPSQLPQGLTEGQMVMLLQKGNQYQAGKSQLPVQQTQLFPAPPEPQPSSTTAITVSHQPAPAPSARIEPFQNPEYVAPPQINMPLVPPQIVDHRPTNDARRSLFDSIVQPTSTLNTTYAPKPSRDIESKGSDEKKKEKSSDAKKDKHGDKDAGDHHKKDSKKDSKKEKSSGKDSKKKKK